MSLRWFWILVRFWLQWSESSIQPASDADSATSLSKEFHSSSREDPWVLHNLILYLVVLSLSWRCCHDPWKRRHPFSTRSTANRATQNTRQHSASAVTRESSARGRQRRASSPVRFVRICEIAVKVFKIAFFCTCLKTVWIAFPKCQFDRHFFSGQELPRAVLHLRRLQRVFERPVCLRCDQWWDCLLWMWHQEERLEMWLMVKLWGTPFVTNTKWKLSWVSCC